MAKDAKWQPAGAPEQGFRQNRHIKRVVRKFKETEATDRTARRAADQERARSWKK